MCLHLICPILISSLVICSRGEKPICGFVLQRLFSSNPVDISETSRCGGLQRVKSLLTASEEEGTFNVGKNTDCTSPILLRRNSAKGTSKDGKSSDKDLAIECSDFSDGQCVRMFFLLRELNLRSSNELINDVVQVIPPEFLNRSTVNLALCNGSGVENLLENSEEVILKDSVTRDIRNSWDYLQSGWTTNSLKILHKRMHVFSFNPSLTSLLHKLIISNLTVSSLLLYNLLINLTALQSFDLSYNGLYSLPENLFQFNSQLETCDLSHNILQAIPGNLFKQNLKLKKLRLNHNHLESLPPELFLNNREIQRIDLDHNRLRHLPSTLFVNNYKMEILLLDDNSLTELPRHLFQRNATLAVLSLSHNQLESVNLSLLDDPTEKTAEELSKFDILRRFLKSKNQGSKLDLLDIDKDISVRTNHLVALNLSHNRLTDFPKDIFKRTMIVRIIDVSNNPGIRKFMNLHFFYSLETILLGNCSIEHIEGILASAASFRVSLVKVLDLSGNGMKGLDRAAFRSCHLLERLDLKDNLLTHLEPGLFQDLYNLYYLDLSGNMLAILPFELFNRQALLHLNLSRNRIYTFGTLPLIDLLQNVNSKLQELDLSSNCLTSTQISSIKVNASTPLFLLYANFEFNALVSLPLVPIGQRTFHLQFGNNLIRKIETTHLRLKVSTPTAVLGPSLEHLNEEPNIRISLCPNPIKKICEGTNQSCEEATPESLYRLSRNFPYVDLKYCHGLREEDNTSFVHKMINFQCPFTPMCPREYYQSLFCDGNATCDLHSELMCRVTELCPFPCDCYKRGFEQQSVVNCSHRKLTSLPQFIPPGAEILHFEHNKLTNLSHLGAAMWKKLMEINVDYNVINYIDFHGLPSAVSKISLRHNRIHAIAVDSLRTDQQIWLGGNPFVCDCNTVDLKTLVSTSRVIADGNDVVCANFNRFLVETDEEQMCEKTQRIVRSVTLALVAGILLPIFVGICLVVYYRNKRTIAAYVFIHHPRVFECFFSSDELVEDKVFDAFISYSGIDTPIVKQFIIHLEEKEPRLKLCIHERDWIPGEDIPTNIASSVLQSRKTILLLSEEFLKSIWFTVELRSAYYQSVEDNVNRLIVVLKGDVPPMETLDEDLQVLLSNRTYLVWGEKWFWEKLRFALSRSAV